MNLFRFAAPQVFYRLSGRLLPWFAAAAVLLAVAGLYVGFGIAPTDFQQGEVYRIIFIHVPSAWMAMFVYLVMAAYALLTLVFRTRLSGMMCRALAPTGALMAAISLWTGAVWGKPTWGTYWVWDARLTSMLVLLLLYLGLLALRSAIEDPNQAGRAAAVLSLVGFVNVPIVKFSVDWWNTLHQPASVFRMDGPTIHASLLWPLMICAIGFTLLMLALHMAAMRNEIYRRRLRVLEARAAAEAAYA